MMLKRRATCENADRLVEKADDTSGNTEDIGGEVCAWGGVMLTVSVERVACAMVGKTKGYHMIFQSILLIPCGTSVDTAVT